MLQTKSIINVADNTGASIVECIKVLKGTKKKIARRLGEYIIISIKKKRKIIEKHKKKKILKKKIYPAIIISLKKNIKRKNGLHIKSDNNKVILMNDFNKFSGNTVKGLYCMELKKHKILKLKYILNKNNYV